MYGPRFEGITKRGLRFVMSAPDPAKADLPFQMLQEQSFHPYFMMGGPPSDLESYRNLVATLATDPKRLGWWIWVEGDFVGLRGLFRIQDDRSFRPGTCIGRGGQMFAAIHPSWRNQGLARASAELVLDHVFGSLEHYGVYTEVLTINEPSVTVVRELGFQIEEEVRGASHQAYQESDAQRGLGFYRLSLLASEWRSRKS